MRLLYVIQRYGADVPGGAEAHTREFAERLVARGHEVEVAASCARDYDRWTDHYPAGTETVEGVTVHRFPVARPRDPEVFARLDARMVAPAVRPRWLEEEWMRLQGPWVPELLPWLADSAARFDAVVFVTYLYWTAWAGLAALERAAPDIPSVLHPTAHDEPYLYFRLFDAMFRKPSAFAFLTPEEDALVRRRFRTTTPGAVVGVGAEPEASGDAAAFRARFGLDDRPYLLFLGRFDVGKAAEELLAYFLALKERSPGPLALVVVGQAAIPVPEHPDIVVTGFVDDATKQGALAGATALVQPSYFESFSIVLLEAWAHRLPVLVQGRCEVLRGQVARSGGGVAYEGFAEFEVAVERLAADPDLRAGLGERGQAFTRDRYGWDRVLDGYETLLAGARPRDGTP